MPTPSPPWRGAARWLPGRLDPESRRLALCFVVKLSVLAALPLPSLVGGRPLAQYLAMVVILCVFGAVVAGAAAAVRGERPGGPSLGLWDEAVAFCAAGVLVGWAAVAAVVTVG